MWIQLKLRIKKFWSVATHNNNQTQTKDNDNMFISFQDIFAMYKTLFELELFHSKKLNIQTQLSFQVKKSRRFFGLLLIVN